MLKKFVIIITVGLASAILVYPFLHELGHIVALVLAGGEVVQVRFLPVPSVLCNMQNVGNGGSIFVGFGGIVFPAITALCMNGKGFVIWFLKIVLLGITVLAHIISIISLLMNINVQDDMIKILKFWYYGKINLIFLLFAGMLIICMLIFAEKPYRRIEKYFEQ